MAPGTDIPETSVLRAPARYRVYTDEQLSLILSAAAVGLLASGTCTDGAAMVHDCGGQHFARRWNGPDSILRRLSRQGLA